MSFDTTFLTTTTVLDDDSSDSAPGSPATRPAENDHLRKPLGGLRILVVDDDDAELEVTRMELATKGAAVIVARSGVEALSTVESLSPDVVLLDLGMPVVNGFAVVEALRLRPVSRGGGTPVAALTGYISRVDRAKAFRVGFQAYLVKPVDADELISTILLLSKH